MNAEEFRAINRFWTQIRAIQDLPNLAARKNRYLVNVALGSRRMNQQEIDIEALVSLTGLGRSSLQKILKEMVDDGLIFLQKDPLDRRRTLVKPTELLTRKSIDMYEETRDLITATADELKALADKK